MEKSIDLHIHSCFSEDGDLTVKEIFSLAKNSGLSGISITDHDSIESISDARVLSKDYEIEYIPGVEITTVFSMDGSQQHLLGYFINEKDKHLLKILHKIQNFRKKVAGKRIIALKKIGFSIEEQRIWEMTDKRAPAATSITLGVLENKDNLEDPRLHEYFHGSKKDNKLMNFYREYFLEGKPAYVPFESISTEEGIDSILKAGGIPVLAHPKFVKKNEWLKIIMDYGIMGIEAISTYHDENDIEYYLSYAEQNGLLVTAGSDFHGPTTKPKVRLGGIKGNYYIYLDKLKHAHANLEHGYKA